MGEAEGDQARRQKVDPGGPDTATRSHASDVRGEEVDTVAVEVAPCSVVVLGGSRIGMSGEDLGVAEWDARVEGVGDRGMA